MRLTAKGTVVLIFFLCCLLYSKHALSQGLIPFIEKLEISAGAGPLIYLGEVGGSPGKGGRLKDISLPSTKIGGGFVIGYRVDNSISLRLSFTRGELGGADSLIKDNGGVEIWRKVRDLHFRSKISELYAGLEIYPAAFLAAYFPNQIRLRPYGVIGLGIFHFNPQALYKNGNHGSQWVDLQPLHLEGQGMKEYPNRKVYSLTQFEIPLGGGVKFEISDNSFLGFELIYRKTFTDYIDDVSADYIDPILFEKYLKPEQAAMAYSLNNRGYSAVTRTQIGDGRGNPKDNDSFISLSLRVGYTLGSRNATPRYIGCPKF